MSCAIPIESISHSLADVITKQLTVKEKKKVRLATLVCGPPKTILPVRRDDRFLYTPYFWSRRFFHLSPPPRNTFPRLSPGIPFYGTLRPEQSVFQKECVSVLNQDHSVILSAYPGFGKCLDPETRIRMRDGTVRCAQDIQVGDFIMGDDDQDRLVQALGSGWEDMYMVRSQEVSLCLEYKVNRHHILTLWDPETQTLYDEDLLSPSRSAQRYGVWKDWDVFSPNRTTTTTTTKWMIPQKKNRIGRIRCDTSSFQGTRITTRLLDRYETQTLKTRREWIHQIFQEDPSSLLWVIEDDSLLVRIQHFLRSCGLVPYTITTTTTTTEPWYLEIYDPASVLRFLTKRVGFIYPLEISRCPEPGRYVGFVLNKNHRFLLESGVVTHNTITTLSLVRKIDLRCMILVNKLILVDQWKESIQRFLGPTTKIQFLQTKDKIDPTVDFYIMNAMNVPKFRTEDFSSIGIVVVDEVHLIMTKVLSQSLGYFCPRYLIGLSATPYRSDGFDELLNLYFGPQRISRSLQKKHTVIRWDSQIKIEPQFDSRGKLIWNSVIEQQTQNRDKDEIIRKICLHHQDRSILILTKRIEHIRRLEQILSQDCSVSTLKENETQFNRTDRVLIATFSKVGTGFSHDVLDLLILACDTEEYFLQYLGRVFRREDVHPIVYDIVDDHPVLKRHFSNRKKVYLQTGGQIRIQTECLVHVPT